MTANWACCAAKKAVEGFDLVGVLGVALLCGVAGCHKTPADPVAAPASAQSAADPADANFAPVDQGGAAPAPAQQPERVLGERAQNESTQQASEYAPQSAAPIERRAPDAGDQGILQNNEVSEATDPYVGDLTSDEATQPPPPLPEYDQPPAPAPDYLWSPGYWAWAPAGYYWVPGAWAAAPYAGALWTPGYWGSYGGRYRFHHGFWGLHIGFYGGVDYGYGYTGHGYYGGYWHENHFFYNRAVTRVNVTVIRNTYVRNVVVNNVVVNNTVINRVSYNGGHGGIQARPGPAEIAVLREQRIPPMQAQVQVQREAAQNRQQFFSENKGRPANAVAARPIMADRTLPTALPRANAPEPRVGAPETSFHGQPGQERVPGQPGAPTVGHPPTAPQTAPPVASERRGGPSTPVTRPGMQNGPGQEVRPVEPQRANPSPQQPGPHQPGLQSVRPPQPSPQPTVRQPAGPQPASPQPRQESRPVQPPAQQPRPTPDSRPVPQTRPEPRPQPQEVRPPVQARPQPATPAQARPEARPQPQPEARPLPPPHPPAEQKAEPHPEERPRV